jgi:hypothetical protein
LSVSQQRKPARYTQDELYRLLPSVYRQRDEEQGGQLKALLGVIADQVGVMEDNIEGLYDNWFIETCNPWVIPYIGDLVGARLLNPDAISRDQTSITGSANHRAYVANTLAYRRRKGTVSMLERLARDITGWDAKAVEYFQLLGWTQYLNHLRLECLRAPDLRDENALELLGTPFESISHTVEVRRIESGRGRYNIPNVGIFLWRLQAFPVVNAPAFNLGSDRYTFDVLGLDEPLYNDPVTELDEFQLAKEANVPHPIRRRDLFQNLQAYYANTGRGNSFSITSGGAMYGQDAIVVCDLTGWVHTPPSGKVAVDPVLGRIAFAPGEGPNEVHVNYFYGFGGEVGAGFFPKPDPDLPAPVKVYRVSQLQTGPGSLSAAFSQWVTDGSPSAVIEIQDSEVYTDTLSTGEIPIPAGVSLELRAAQTPTPQRPVLTLNQSAPAPLTGALVVKGAAPGSGQNRASFIINGIVFNGMHVNADNGDLGALTFRYCTIVPAGDVSITVGKGNDNCIVTLDRTITAGVDSSACEATLQATDSILDRKGAVAINSYVATIERSTVFGEVHVGVMKLGSDSIFMDVVRARRVQTGCMRFSYFPAGSRVPRPFKCQPTYPEGATDAQKEARALAVKPRFTSENYGDPGYAELRRDVAPEIFGGADNGAEMGAFNFQLAALRIENLEFALDEYLRFGLEAGVLLAS